jgi:pyridoxal phosphate enzyme (YggS family)
VRDAGLSDIGENRVQEMGAKVDVIGKEGLRWHLIGHLQRNKVGQALQLADVIHSIDSVRLAAKLSEEATAANLTVEGLVQINASGEGTKGGFDPDKAIDEIGEICSFPALRVRGLMTMAPLTDDEQTIRAVFQRVERLRNDAAAAVKDFEPFHLSMGMSNDYEIAVEEGSTLLRLGTVLLGERRA